MISAGMESCKKTCHIRTSQNTYNSKPINNLLPVEPAVLYEDVIRLQTACYPARQVQQ